MTEIPACVHFACVHFGREICGDLAVAERREWWLANGLGAYAAGTVAGTLTRTYHGLLVAPVQPPLGRLLVFAKADATLLDGARVRPNQIFALSLPHSPLASAAQARALEVVGRELLTSYGLRSLNPDDPAFQPYYRGGVRERDGSYHQGPVWGWLLGHYALAHYRVHHDARAALECLQPLRDHLLDAGLGTLSEIFDGAAPHTPRGCPAQAWSVACTLGAWHVLTRSLTGAPSAVSGNRPRQTP